jgi:Iron-containing alcohol dehydrogenase
MVSANEKDNAMLSVFCAPTRYTQGRGATTALGREMSALGLEGPALVIAGKTVIGQLADTWKASLAEAGIHHELLRLTGECSPIEIERGENTVDLAYSEAPLYRIRISEEPQLTFSTTGAACWYQNSSRTEPFDPLLLLNTSCCP